MMVMDLRFFQIRILTVLLCVTSRLFETGCQRLYQNFVENIKSQLVCLWS